MRELWKRTVLGIIFSLIVYIVASAPVIGIDTFITVTSFYFGVELNVESYAVLAIVCVIAMLAGFAWFYLNLSKFINLQKTVDDIKCISKLRTAYILITVGILIGLIPLFGWIVNLVCQILAYVRIYIAFEKYSNSQVLGVGGKTGASLLKIYALLALISNVLLDLFFTSYLGMIGFIIAWVLLFMGWVKIANDTPREKEA